MFGTMYVVHEDEAAGENANPLGVRGGAGMGVGEHANCDADISGAIIVWLPDSEQPDSEWPDELDGGEDEDDRDGDSSDSDSDSDGEEEEWSNSDALNGNNVEMDSSNDSSSSSYSQRQAEEEQVEEGGGEVEGEIRDGEEELDELSGRAYQLFTRSSSGGRCLAISSGACAARVGVFTHPPSCI
jgi:hypothetical protein